MPPDMTIVSQLLRPEKVKYDARNFTWLGRVFGSNQITAVRRDSGVLTIDQAKEKQVLMASTGKGSPTFIITALVNGLLNTKFKIVEGYKGSHRTKLSVEQGETQGISLAWASYRSDRADWFKGDNSFMVPLIQSGFEREPEWPNVPLIKELAPTEAGKAAAAMVATSSLFGRGLALPPGVPSKIIEPLRKAFWDTVQSAEFKAEVERTKLDYSPKKGAEIQATVAEVMKISPDAVASARKAIFGK
jgi:tripartite-type tricarboxylate transporter receptor subunit TctC